MQQSVSQSFLAFTTPLEGKVNWMYLDVKGLVTIGIGNLIDPVSLALPLPFVHDSDSSPASQSEIQAEWTKVKGNASLAQSGYKAAGPPFTSLQLTDAAINQLVLAKLNQNEAGLKGTAAFANFDSWPADAQLGLLSMAWAMGSGFALSGWPAFTAACASQNWAAAAQNCNISTTGNPGVVPRNTADVLLFNNAAAVAAQKLPFSVLHWPNSVPAAGAGTGGTTAPGSGTQQGSGAGSGTAGPSSGAGAPSTAGAGQQSGGATGTAGKGSTATSTGAGQQSAVRRGRRAREASRPRAHLRAVARREARRRPRRTPARPRRDRPTPATRSDSGDSGDTSDSGDSADAGDSTDSARPTPATRPIAARPTPVTPARPTPARPTRARPTRARPTPVTLELDDSGDSSDSGSTDSGSTDSGSTTRLDRLRLDRSGSTDSARPTRARRTRARPTPVTRPTRARPTPAILVTRARLTRAPATPAPTDPTDRATRDLEEAVTCASGNFTDRVLKTGRSPDGRGNGEDQNRGGMTDNQLGSINHVVVLVLENRSFDHMLGLLYSDSGNVSPLTKQPFEGLTGKESNSDATGNSVSVSTMSSTTSNVYFMPGADPGEGFAATNVQLFGEVQPTGTGPVPQNAGFVKDFAATLSGIDASRPMVPGTVDSNIMGCFTPASAAGTFRFGTRFRSMRPLVRLGTHRDVSEPRLPLVLQPAKGTWTTRLRATRASPSSAS